MRFLRKNTAVIITVGPFYDKTDGVTIENALTITNERITLTADTDDGAAPTLILDNITGATAATANDLNYITGGDAGLMQMELAAADVNRLGRMFLSITDAANHVPVFHEFMVLNAALYDALFATTGGAIPNVAAEAAGGLYTRGTGAGQINQPANGMIDGNVVRWLGTAAATPTVAGVPEVDITHVAGAATTATLDTIKTETASIQADTNDIQARLPAALVSGRIDASVGAMAAGVITAAAVATGAIDADALATDAVTKIRSLVSGTADSGSTTTMVDAARTEADTDYWKGCLLLFTSGTISGQVRLITAFDAATFTFAPATTQAVATQTYEILLAARSDVELWDGSAVNALISGRVNANAQVVGTGAVVAGSFAAGAIDNAAFNVTETLTANPAAGGITAASFGAGAIDNAAFNVTETLTANPAVGGIAAASFAAGAIDAAAIATGAITAAKFAAGAIDAAAIAADAITAAKIAPDAIGASELAADAVTEIQVGLATSAALATVQADTDNIQTRLPAALSGGRMSSDVQAINNNTSPVSRLERSARTIIKGTVGAASSTTSIVTSSLDPAAAVTDQFKGRIVIFDETTTTVNLRGQATDITASTAGGVLTVTALTTAPVSGDTFTGV